MFFKTQGIWFAAYFLVSTTTMILGASMGISGWGDWVLGALSIAVGWKAGDDADRAWRKHRDAKLESDSKQ